MHAGRRYLLEAMVPELEDLEKRGYFSRSEVKQIAQRRQDFEYALKRKAALKTDFLRCPPPSSPALSLRQTTALEGRRSVPAPASERVVLDLLPLSAGT